MADGHVKLPLDRAIRARLLRVNPCIRVWDATPSTQHIETIRDVRDSHLQARRHFQLRSSLHTHLHRLGECSGLRQALQDEGPGTPLTRLRSSEGNERLAPGGPGSHRCCITHADLGGQHGRTSHDGAPRTSSGPSPRTWSRTCPRHGAIQYTSHTPRGRIEGARERRAGPRLKSGDSLTIFASRCGPGTPIR